MKQEHTVLILTPPKSYQAQPSLEELGLNCIPKEPYPVLDPPLCLHVAGTPGSGAQQPGIPGCSPNQTATSQGQIPSAPASNSGRFARPGASCWGQV